MKNSIAKTILAVGVFAGVTALAGGKPLPKTNLDQILNSGTKQQHQGPTVALAPGIYVMGDENSKLFGTDYLIVDNYINDDSQVLAIMISQNSWNGRQATVGKFMLGKPIKNGASIMLSPVYIDISGNLTVESEMSEHAAVIEVSRQVQSDKYRYPYMVQGHNGALNGRLLGMRSKSSQNPNLKAWPTNNVFEGQGSQNNIVISGSTVSIQNGQMDQRFELIPINGERGKFAELAKTELNTMGEYEVTESEVQKLAFFMRQGSHDVFVIATPAMKVGEYVFEFYDAGGRSLSDIFLPGKL